MAIALVFGFVCAYSWIAWRHTYSHYRQYLVSLAALSGKSVDTYFFGLEAALRSLGETVRDEDRYRVPDAGSRLLRLFNAAHPEFNIVNVTNADGQILSSSGGPSANALPSVSREPTVRAALSEFERGRNMAVSRPFLGRITGDWNIVLRYGVRDESGNLLFYVGAGLPLSKTLSLWKDAPYPKGSATGIMRDDGFFMLRYPTPASMDLEKVYGSAVAGQFQKYLAQTGFPSSGFAERENSLTGGTSLFAFNRLEHYPATLTITSPISNVWDDWWQAVRPVYLLMALLLLASIGIYLWARRRQRAWDAKREQRMAALETANQELESFSYTVSHDLRSPVRAVDGYAAILADECGPMLTEDGRRKIEQIRHNAERMGHLIDGLLSFARSTRQPVRKQKTDLAEIAKAVVADLVPTGGRVEVKIESPLPCEADPELMRIVIGNLVSNALKFTGRESCPRVEIGCSENAYFVRDNGIGFDMAHASHLFEVFSRLHGQDEFEGIGAGLAIAKRIIDRHGGRIWANAQPGEGAEFRFTLGEPAAANADAQNPG